MRIVAEDPSVELGDWMIKALGLGLLVWLGLVGFYVGTRQNKQVYRGAVDGDGIRQEIVLDSIEPITTVEVEVEAATLNNSWVVVHTTLINTKTEQASHVPVELGYWSGPGWSEGRRKKTVVRSGVPNGKYILQILPEWDPKVGDKKVPLNVRVVRDVTMYRYPVCTLFLVLGVPLLSLFWIQNQRVRARMRDKLAASRGGGPGGYHDQRDGHYDGY